MSDQHQSSSGKSTGGEQTSPEQANLKHDDNATLYWRANRRLILALLAVWAFVSYGLSIFWIEELNAFPISDYLPWFKIELGFWFAQQGSIYVFVVLIFVYAIVMDRLDRKYGMEEK